MTKKCAKKLNWDERKIFLWRKKKLARPRACRWRLSRRWTKALTDPKQDPDLERRFRNVWKTNSRLPQDFRPLPLLDLRSLFRLLTKLFRCLAMFSKLCFIGGNKQWSIKRLHMKSLILFYPHKVAKNSWFIFVVLRKRNQCLIFKMFLFRLIPTTPWAWTESGILFWISQESEAEQEVETEMAAATAPSPPASTPTKSRADTIRANRWSKVILYFCDHFSSDAESTMCHTEIF